MFDQSTYTVYESEGVVKVTLSLRNGFKVKDGFNVTVVSTDNTAFGKFANQLNYSGRTSHSLFTYVCTYNYYIHHLN